MNCQETQNRLAAFLDDALESDRQQQVADHLASCVDCQAEARALEKTWDLLGTLKAIEPDPGYRVRFWQAVDARLPWHAKLTQYVQALLGQSRWVPAAAGAAILLLVSVITISQLLQKPAMLPELVGLKEAELEMVATLEMVEDFEIIQDIEFFADFDIIEKLNGQETS
ncbi:MAG: zf-HC2 domain-containing protein [Desulfobacterales bacterium]|nr:zf-HC2 domain-containing protein [Desulfobacterales bacterium]